MKVIRKGVQYKLHTHLHASEFDCKCDLSSCFVTLINPSCINAFTVLRILVGQPLILTSGFRCPIWNREVGGVPSSFHLTGSAMDFVYPKNYPKDNFIKYCKTAFDVVMSFDNYVHCHVRR